MATNNKELTTEVERIVTEFTQELKKLYGDQLIKIVLYGSHARGDTNEDSDIDIMVVLKTKISAGDEIFRMGAIKNKLNLKYNEMLSVFPIAEEDFLFKQTPLAAELLLNHNLYRSSVSRSYYALYHTVQALLAAKNINTRTHKGAIQQFGQHFIKTGELSSELSKFLGDVFDLRHLSDYDETATISQQQAQLTLDNTKLFMEQAIAYLTH